MTTEFRPLTARTDKPASESLTSRNPEAGHRGPRALGDVFIQLESVQTVPATGEIDEDSEVDELTTARSHSCHSSITLNLFVAVVFSSVLLFVLSQVLFLLTAIQGLPWPAQIPSYVVLGIALLTMGAFLTRIAWLWTSLKASPQILFPTRALIADRRQLQVAATRQRHGKELLSDYLRDYPLDGGRRCYRWSSQTRTELTTARSELLDVDQPHGSAAWIEKFSGSFARVLDQRADARVKSAAVHVGLKTAAISNPLIDTCVVAIALAQLTGDLCQIYNLRASRWGTLVILGHAFASLFAAKHAEEAADELANEVVGEINDAFTAVAVQIGKRLGEGTANGLLIYRFGHVAKGLMQPMRR